MNPAFTSGFQHGFFYGAVSMALLCLGIWLVHSMRSDTPAQRYRKIRALHWSDYPPVIVVNPDHVPVGAQTYSGERLDDVLDHLKTKPMILTRRKAAHEHGSKIT